MINIEGYTVQEFGIKFAYGDTEPTESDCKSNGESYPGLVYLDANGAFSVRLLNGGDGSEDFFTSDHSAFIPYMIINDEYIYGEYKVLN